MARSIARLELVHSPVFPGQVDWHGRALDGLRPDVPISDVGMPDEDGYSSFNTFGGMK
jgi:hypothetical protein